VLVPPSSVCRRRNWQTLGDRRDSAGSRLPRRRQHRCQEILCIRVLGGSGRRYASIGDVIVTTVKDAIPGAGVKRARWSRPGRPGRQGAPPSRRFVHPVRRERRGLIKDGGDPRGTRIFGPVGREFAGQAFHEDHLAAPRRCCNREGQERTTPSRSSPVGTRAREARSSRPTPARTRVLVEGVNRVKKHTRVRTTQRGAKTGGIVTQEASIHVSNSRLSTGWQGDPHRLPHRRERSGRFASPAPLVRTFPDDDRHRDCQGGCATQGAATAPRSSASLREQFQYANPCRCPVW